SQPSPRNACHSEPGHSLDGGEESALLPLPCARPAGTVHNPRPGMPVIPSPAAVWTAARNLLCFRYPVHVPQGLFTTLAPECLSFRARPQSGRRRGICFASVTLCTSRRDCSQPSPRNACHSEPGRSLDGGEESALLPLPCARPAGTVRNPRPGMPVIPSPAAVWTAARNLLCFRYPVHVPQGLFATFAPECLSFRARPQSGRRRGICFASVTLCTSRRDCSQPSPRNACHSEPGRSLDGGEESALLPLPCARPAGTVHNPRPGMPVIPSPAVWTAAR